MKPELSQADINSFAIFSIKTGSQFTLGDTYASLIWSKNNTEEKPTEQEFDDAVTAWKTDYDAQEYARNRQADYPNNRDQWDMIYKDNKNSTTTHAAAVEAVKTKWPKDNSGPV